MRLDYLKTIASFMIYLIICLTFTVTMIPSITANEDIEEGYGCCQETLSGDMCLFTKEENCKDNMMNPLQTCERTAVCKVGCCISDDGVCSMQVPKAICESNEGYTWREDELCLDYAECDLGCCVLGGAACITTTKKRCEMITEDYPGLELNFRQVGSEQECQDICRASDIGCCVSREGCTWQTRAMCGLPDGIGEHGFYKDIYCSNEHLPCDCEAKFNMDCIDGKEKVYWFDSCGNPEGVVYEQIEGSVTGDGNCNYFKGSLCTRAHGEYKTAYCKDLNCYDTDESPNVIYSGGDRKHGDSWCDYDSATGPWMDLPGSEHYRRVCINGEEIVEPCRSFREEICMIGDLEFSDLKLSSSSCVPFNGEPCITQCYSAKDYETESDGNDYYIAKRKDKLCCEDPEKTCIWSGPENNPETSVDENIKDGICLPIVPIGLKFWTTYDSKTDNKARDICEYGTINCNTAWFKDMMTNWKWDCEKDCDCYSDNYLSIVNDQCTAIGDCGAHFNYLGYFTKEGLIRYWDGEPKGKPSETINSRDDFNEYSKTDRGLYLGNVEVTTSLKQFIINEEASKITIRDSLKGGHGERFKSSMLSAAVIGSAFLLAMGISIWIGAAALQTLLAGLFAILPAAATLPVVGWITAVVVAIIIATLYAVSLKVYYEKRMVTTTCDPYHPPRHGYDCSICDIDPMKPCTEYKCRSIGVNCAFIKENEGTDRPKCFEDDRYDVAPPIIKPWHETLKIMSRGEDISDQFTINEQSNGYEIKGEVPSFSSITFGIKTDKLSQCRIDFDVPEDFVFNYNSLKLPFPDTYYDTTHNLTLNTVLPDKEYTMYAICVHQNSDLDQTVTPYTIKFQTNDLPDMHPPVIIGTSIADDGLVKHDSEKLYMQLYVEEDSEFTCKYSRQDVGFDLMENNMTCYFDPPESTSKMSYSICVTELNITTDEENFYFRCKDDPINAEPNENMVSYPLRVKRTKPLNITSAIPYNEEIFAREATLEVRLKDGADNGKAVCWFDNGKDLFGEFFESNSSTNKHQFINMPRAYYNFDISCEDRVGNTASTEINFSISVDEIPAHITNIYRVNNDIRLELNKEAVCEYSNQSFFFGSGDYNTPYSKTHTLSNLDIYHVVCEDRFENRNPEFIIGLLDYKRR